MEPESDGTHRPQRRVRRVRGAAGPRSCASEALEIAAVQMATGMGVVIAAILAAAGPGCDFVDGSAELRRANGTVLTRFASRVVAVAALQFVCMVFAALLLIGATAIVAHHNGYSLRLLPGSLDIPFVATAFALAAAQATWVIAVVQRQQTQATQFALPVGIVVVVLLLSRLLPYPLTPDSWLGPLLRINADRQLHDFWWSVGGKILWPWGNLVLVGLTLAAAIALGLRLDRRVDPR